MTRMPARVLSGIQPTADSFHLGNYLGALRSWVQMQDTHDAYYCVVDLHAVTADYAPADLHQRTLTSFAQLLALGLDPERCTLFVQSHVPEHPQLAWLLSCITGFGEASRMTQFKDKSAKGGAAGASVGLFTYPILQAADILLYQADAVPVGEDQRQHLELTRDLAERFNNRFGETLTVPEATILTTGAKVLDVQEPTAKMSKSNPSGCLSLLDDTKTLRKKVMRAVTDSEPEIRYDPESKPGVSNLITILASLTGESNDAVVARFDGQGYGVLKGAVADAVLDLAEPFAARTHEYLADPGELERLMAVGAQKARTVASQTLSSAMQAMGFVQPDQLD